MGILSTTKKKGIPVKKLTACLTLTLLFALSVSASSPPFKITAYGKALADTSIYFFVSIKGKDSSDKRAININDTIKKDTSVIFKDSPTDSFTAIKTLNISVIEPCSLTITIKREGFLFGGLGLDVPNDSILCDSSTYTTGPRFNFPFIGLFVKVFEKCPKITRISYTNDSLHWGTRPGTIVASQSLWISQDMGLNFSRLDSLNPLSPTQTSYSWAMPNKSTIIKIKTVNADSSDSSIITLSYTGTKNKITADLIPQKTPSAIFNAQGRLIYKGVIDSRYPKFSTGEYFTSNKTLLLLH